jgi:hypothetical protein
LYQQQITIPFARENLMLVQQHKTKLSMDNQTMKNLDEMQQIIRDQVP